jgi:hypothetical protein
MVRINQFLIRHSDVFFGYERPTDFRLEERHPELFPTNVRPETLAQDAAIKQQAAEGKIPPAQFLRFTSPERTPYPENDLVNARWYPAPRTKTRKRPKQAIVVLPQWNADGFSHNSLCTIFNKMGISALRLSMPYHDIRRPEELERSDYNVSANIGRTLSACRQAVVDIRCCLDWLEEQGYEHFGVLGTSLGSCYAFLASAHDARLRVNAFNHASTAFGDVTWAGQSTRHVKQALEEAGLTQERVRALWAAVSPCSYYDKIMQPRSRRTRQKSADGLRRLRPDLPQGVLAAGGGGLPARRPQLRAARAALRPLHHRRNALQVHRRLVHGLVCLPRLQGAAEREGGGLEPPTGFLRPRPRRKRKQSPASAPCSNPAAAAWRGPGTPLPADGPVQVRAGDAAGSAAQPQQVAGRHALALLHVDPAQVHREREQPQPVVDDHAVALVVERPGQHHHPAVARPHRRSRPRRESPSPYECWPACR